MDNKKGNTPNEMENKAVEKIQEIRGPENFMMRIVKGCIILNIFSIGMNFPRILKITPELVNKQNFTSIILMILVGFGLISLIIPILEEFEYNKLTKEFSFSEYSIEEIELIENKYEKFFNKYQIFYKIQKQLSNILKGIAIALLLYYCTKLGPDFGM